ncbi:hypothetical protein RFI_30225 [Reticulomyxa filosa]|uniref:Mitochondrial carrier protein n=1 Tax=Reticulomyxa filosa TaxID=46433 RepID=X6LZ04_RETFI|nr:hypothetical protein RFI_30225 [Reticulomyxa filosa]|eukprot:ETO07168.1 hypothetical protein RFI_30225 [Reticulomyxa filosa]
MSPILLARTRVNQYLTERAAAEGHIKTSFFREMSISMSILNKELHAKGISTLFIGMPAMVFKRSIDWGSRFLLMRWLRHAYFDYNGFDSKRKLNDMEELAIAFGGGTLSVFVTMPIDRLMPILQAAGRTKDATIWSITIQKFRAEGLGTLQRGLVFRTIHCGWHTSFAIFLSQKIYNIIDQKI